MVAREATGAIGVRGPLRAAVMRVPRHTEEEACAPEQLA
jgi:hypothetical protein